MEKLRIAVMASYNGSTAQAVISEIETGTIPAETSVIISNNASAPVLEFGRNHQPPIPTVILNRHTHPNPEEEDRQIAETLAAHNADLVVLSGYARKIGPQTVDRFRGRILNIHPALPDSPYKGQGFFGDAIHKAVLEAREATTGIMIHVVDEDFDTGPVIATAEVPVQPKDTVETLRRRVQAAERPLLVGLVRDIATGKRRLPLG